MSPQYTIHAKMLKDYSGS